jgi:hypothetical protein
VLRDATICSIVPGSLRTLDLSRKDTDDVLDDKGGDRGQPLSRPPTAFGRGTVTMNTRVRRDICRQNAYAVASELTNSGGFCLLYVL